MRIDVQLLFLLLLSSTLAIGQNHPTASGIKGLKDYYADYFPIGVSVGPRNFSGPDSALITTEFSSITAENIMKMGPIHPEIDSFNWGPADQMMEFARTHGLKVRGHTLCWHSQAGQWLFKDAEGQPVSREVLLARLKDHIYQVAGRYKDMVYAWDVVNEVISDASDEYFRNSEWFQICGEDFIYKAFEYAHQAAPDALLFYNDYNAVKPEKRNKIIRMLQHMKDQGIPVHGVGLQGHWSISSPTEAELREALTAYAKLGLQIQITELDISIYPSEGGRRTKRADESDAFTPELEQQQLELYRMIFRVFRDYKDVISGVTFWNVSDRRSWLDNFPVRGRKNYPLLFDQNNERKKAYQAVTDF